MTGDGSALTAEQFGLWYQEQVSDTPSLYAEPVLFRIEGDLDPERLRAALSGVLGAHARLGGAILVEDGWPVLVPGGSAPDVTVEQLDPPPGTTAREALRAYATGLWHQGFDTGRGPLCRARVLCLGPHGYGLLLMVHHVVGDGWSVRLLCEEIAEAYRLRCSPSAAETGAGTTGDGLGGVPGDLLPGVPADLTGAVVVDPFPSSAAEVVPRSFTLPADTTGLDHAALVRRVTPFTLHMAAFQQAVATTSGARRFLVAFPDAARSPDTVRTVDCLIRMRLAVAAVPAAGHGEATLDSVCDALYDAVDGPSLTPDVLGALTAAGLPSPSVALGVDTMPGLSLPGATATWLPVALPRAKFALSLMLFQQGGEPSGSGIVVEYDAARVTDDEAHAVVDQYLALLGEWAAAG
ncbi:condensation domain-containing protein [Kitasatospora xanthocidica]|uniref:condensation domain-containing protein n=1 Tax=Kitasatospora xanthocidica TaxID=83382 RepID=UPI0015F33240|nr:condensation domain-containing protein [Kitasatospora xanthocidica]